MENIPAYRDLFQFVEINIAVDVYIVEGNREGWHRIKVKFASTSVPECNVKDFWP